MGERRYKVLIGNELVADSMDIKTATILVRALFEEYYLDSTMTISIKGCSGEERMKYKENE